MSPSAGAPSLVGDIGGTSARFGLVPPGSFWPESERVLTCAEHPSLAAAVEAYLAVVAPPLRPRDAAIAVASPVVGDAVRFTNLDWKLSIAATREVLGLERLRLLNDFTALALSLPALGPDDFTVLRDGPGDPDAPLALLGPGTGLGVSGLVPCGAGAARRWLPLATEGGHRDLAAATEAEWAVVRVLAERYGRVSAERVLSGPGLAALDAALAVLDGERWEEAAPDAVTARAAAGEARAVAAVALFTGWLGAVAGDLALTLGARGGVWLGGGVVPRLGELFDRELFVGRFLAKGRFAGYLAPIPVRLITHPTPALLGAARALADG